jgi:DNA-binding response OmpR family regulator
MCEIKILLVEDDPACSQVVKDSLELMGGYDVCVAGNGVEGYEVYKTFRPDLIVSDVEMPEMSGLEMVKCIRKEDHTIPIILASAKTGPKDLVKGFQLEVDDYIKKPYLPPELNLHIKAVLRRTVIQKKPNPDRTALLPIGAYLLDTHTHLLKWGKEEIKLTTRESQILEMLYEHKGEVVKRENILQHFWAKDDFYASRSLDVFVNKLRKYLVKDTSIQIQTVWKEGFYITF